MLLPTNDIVFDTPPYCPAAAIGRYFFARKENKKKLSDAPTTPFFYPISQSLKPTKITALQKNKKANNLGDLEQLMNSNFVFLKFNS